MRIIYIFLIKKTNVKYNDVVSAVEITIILFLYLHSSASHATLIFRISQSTNSRQCNSEIRGKWYI